MDGFTMFPMLEHVEPFLTALYLRCFDVPIMVPPTPTLPQHQVLKTKDPVAK